MRRIVLMILMAGAAISIGSILMKAKVPAVAAEFVTVQRADVHQVAAITGRLMYEEEVYLTAPTSGVISRVCVETGQRVSEGELLLCLDSCSRDQVMAVVYGNNAEIAISAFSETLSLVENADMVLRGDMDCTVRQIMVQEGAPVTKGTPVMRATSNQQQIVCNVPWMDAEKLAQGMWAWISSEGEAVGIALITDIGTVSLDETTGLRCRSVFMKPQSHIDMPEGASVDAEVYLAGSDDVLSLPLEAITDRQTVWWVNEGRCTEIPAQIVLCDEMRAWVDLPEGLTVAVGEFQEGQRITEAEK